MTTFNPDFWEVPADSRYLERFPADRALWFETEVDRERRHAVQEFFQCVLPVVQDLIDAKLTGRQRQVVRLYYFDGKTQEDIATLLDLSQSTVSRHLFGTVRNGRKVGGAVHKLQRIIARGSFKQIDDALDSLRTRFAKAS